MQYFVLHLELSPLYIMMVMEDAVKLQPIYGNSKVFKARDEHNGVAIAWLCITTTLAFLGSLSSKY